MKFSDEFLFKNVTLKKFRQFPAISIKESLLINDGSNSIVKIQDQKLLHSWNLEHPHFFSSAAVYCSEDDSLYCIVNNNTLLKWSPDDETLNNGSEFQFQEPVFSVIPLRKHKPIVLFSSGKVLLTELLYVSLDPIGKAFISEDEELLWADGIEIPSETKIFCLTLPKDSTSYKFHSFSIRKGKAADYTSKLLENGQLILKSWCFDHYNTAFITIWSDGTVHTHPVHSLTPSLLLQHKSIKNPHKLAISVINADHIAIAVNDSKKKETKLEMWDVKFTSLKAEKTLKTSPAEYYQLITLDSSLFLQLDEILIEIPFNIDKSTLAAALGKSSDILSKTEYRWNASTLATEIEKQSDDAMDIDCSSNKEALKMISRKNAIEKMDTGEIANEIEILANRFINEGSMFKTNNRESDLFNLLCFALRLKYKKKTACSIDPDVLLVNIFTSTYRESTLVQYMRKILLLDAVRLLEILLDISENKITVSSCDMPSDAQIFDWVFILMKSHIDVLLSPKDKKIFKLRKRLDTYLSEKIGIYEDYLLIQNMFDMIKKENNILPIKHTVGKYFVETIDI
ncbi:nucleolar protein 11 isoform X2 [Parasteatoda tepidariorum]|uniref:nucleolar protein 11 isoform X2 n=1 Tax=Parasteatoda tepidariorum TaxID=114398 RepID=UPI001C71FE54|nr:nucleolar protein 11 isoform X2 [Parasteatoda tepidariorum]